MANNVSQEIVIDGKKYRIDATIGNFKATLIDNQPVPNPDPEPKDPTKPTEGFIKPEGWGADLKNKDAWHVVNMRDFPEQFKVVDAAGKNVATNFKTKEAADNFINFYKTHPFPPTPEPEPTDPTDPQPPPVIDPNAKVDAQGVVMIYAPKVGGQVVTATETNQKESSHNTGSRTSLYSNKPYSAISGEITEYFVMDLSDDDEQNAPKLLSGGHTGSGDNDETRQGQCYAVGVNQNGSLHLAKEYPHHPTTPKAYNKIQYLDPNWKNLGSIKNKFVGMKIIYFPIEKNGKKGMHMEWWFDKKALETGKKENDWKQMAFAEDFGDWGSQFGPPHLENMGVKYKGKIMGFYIRIDTPKKPVKFSHQGQHELEIPPRRLV